MKSFRKPKSKQSPDEQKFRRLLRQADHIARFPAKMNSDVALDALTTIMSTMKKREKR